MGKFHRILEPGLNVLLPVVDRVKYVQSLKEIAIDVPKQSAITSDNVTLSIDGVLYLRILDPYLASYGVEDPEFAITQLAQTTMRSELGKMSLDKVFRERESLNISIVESINKASEAWGISCLRYEIRDIKLPSRVHEAMQMQVEAERRKRAAILESEGVRAADINVAEGKRQSRILASEAQKQEEINRANGEAAAIMALADARAKSLKIVAESLANEHGRSAASLSVAEKYVVAFEKLAKHNNTLIVPSTASDVTSMVAQVKSLACTRSCNFIFRRPRLLRIHCVRYVLALQTGLLVRIRHQRGLLLLTRHFSILQLTHPVRIGREGNRFELKLSQPRYVDELVDGQWYTSHKTRHL